MAKNWGRTPVSNADKLRTAQAKYFVDTNDGPEERIDRRPQGKVERFVDKAGNVCSLQMHADGDSQRAASAIRMRSQYHAKGFVEFSKCPVKHGTRHANSETSREFAKMPADLQGECKHDPKVMERVDGDLYARSGCPHIEWLIKHRTDKEAAQAKKRNSARIAQEKRAAEKVELESIQLEMAREQAKEFKAKKKAATPAKAGE